MNAFEERYNNLFEFLSVVGWDGYSAAAVTPAMKENTYQVWQYYDLQEKPHELTAMSTGMLVFEVPCIHGLLEIYISEETYTACIISDCNKIIMPDVTRKF